MDDPLNEDVFQKALSIWGENAQVGMVMEEIGEVIEQLGKTVSSINKFYRNRIDTEELIEEFVDVYIMMKQMRYMNKELFESIYNRKVVLIKARLEKSERNKYDYRNPAIEKEQL